MSKLRWGIAFAWASAVAPAMAEDGWHGSLSFGTEVERWSCQDGCSSDEAGGKTKASMLNLSLRPSGVEGLSIGIYHGREFPHDGSKQNIITEFWANQAITDNFWLGGVLASESGDNRFDVGVKAGGTIDLGNGFDSHGYSFVKHRFAGDTGGLEGNYFELEPGIGLKLNEAFGGWLNFRYQGWDWDTAADEREWIIKPGVWHHPEGKFDYALWAEIGEFQKAALDYTEDYVKLGLSANYKFTETTRLSGSASYKWRVDEDDLAATEKERRFPFIGVNYTIDF